MSNTTKPTHLKSVSNNPATKSESRKSNKPKSLTPKQLHYCRCRASGSNMSDSYRESYSTANMTKKSINELACRLDANVKIRSRIDQLIKLKEQALVRSAVSLRTKVLVKLEGFMDSATQTDGNKIRAAELLGKSIGLFKDVIENTTESSASSEELTATLERKLAELQSTYGG